ncbi:MAG: class I SAM-dependent RNA methyltransferase [Armatimonadetes bacterium]|nr:class I SAM-dependent RNA methyltransferase [Armatimonadota bacterium]
MNALSGPAQLADGCELRCRGCAHREQSLSQSLERKIGWLHRRLEPWSERLQPVRSVIEERRWAYRDRVRLGAEWSGDWRFGTRARDELVPIPRCPVHSPRVNRTLSCLARHLPPGFPLAFYVQAGAQATLVAKTRQLPPLDWLSESGQAELAAAGLEGLWLHLHPAAGKRMFARSGWRLLWGQPRSRDAGGLLHGPQSFQQAMPELYQASLDEAERFLMPSPADRVVDLCCGIGASLVRWLRSGAEVAGVELNGEAVECARENAPGAMVLRGKCAHRLPQLEAWVGAPNRLLYVNPPRTGLEPQVLEWIGASYRPRRMAYLSCSAGTLRRDLERLCGFGCTVEALLPFDFFPQTRHVEVLSLLLLAESRSLSSRTGPSHP